MFLGLEQQVRKVLVVGGYFLLLLFSMVEERKTRNLLELSGGKCRGVSRWKGREKESFLQLQTINKELVQVELLGCRECGRAPLACDPGTRASTKSLPLSTTGPWASALRHLPLPRDAGEGMKSNAKNINKQETLTTWKKAIELCFFFSCHEPATPNWNQNNDKAL